MMLKAAAGVYGRCDQARLPYRAIVRVQETPYDSLPVDIREFNIPSTVHYLERERERKRKKKRE